MLNSATSALLDYWKRADHDASFWRSQALDLVRESAAQRHTQMQALSLSRFALAEMMRRSFGVAFSNAYVTPALSAVLSAAVQDVDFDELAEYFLSEFWPRYPRV